MDFKLESIKHAWMFMEMRWLMRNEEVLKEKESHEEWIYQRHVTKVRKMLVSLLVSSFPFILITCN